MIVAVCVILFEGHFVSAAALENGVVLAVWSVFACFHAVKHVAVWITDPVYLHFS